MISDRILEFTKMEGCGNDYVYVNGFTQTVSQEEKPQLVRRLSDRHFGIGGDGVIFINPVPVASEEEGKTDPVADFEMEMYNADGSRGEMCGNGIRCVAKYVYDHGLTAQTKISVITAGSVKHLTLIPDESGSIGSVRVDMGAPILEAEKIPVRPELFSGSPFVIAQDLCVAEKIWQVTCVSMGNPHAVVFVDNVDDFPVLEIGPHFEHHPAFPNRTNTEFVQVLDKARVKMRVFERGTGETLACGTGCCATAVACVLNGLTEDEITVEVPGGELLIRWDREANTVWMTGPATEVFTGKIRI